MTPRQRFVCAALISALVVAASTVIVLVALAGASGVTQRPGPETCCDTEFIDMSVLQLSWLAAPVLAVAAFLSVRAALVGTVGVAVSQFWAMTEMVRRYHETGWSDGLEVLGYLFPIALTVVTLVAVLVGGLVGKRRRGDSAQDQ